MPHEGLLAILSALLVCKPAHRCKHHDVQHAALRYFPLGCNHDILRHSPRLLFHVEATHYGSYLMPWYRNAYCLCLDEVPVDGEEVHERDQRTDHLLGMQI